MHRALLLRVSRERSGTGHTGLGARSQLRFDSAPWMADFMGLYWGKTPPQGGLGIWVAVGFGYDLFNPLAMRHVSIFVLGGSSSGTLPHRWADGIPGPGLEAGAL